MTHPHLYAVMFGAALAGFEPTRTQSEASIATIVPLGTAVRRSIDSGLLAGDCELITNSIWAAVHGVVSIRLACAGPATDAGARELFDATMHAILRGWLA